MNQVLGSAPFTFPESRQESQEVGIINFPSYFWENLGLEKVSSVLRVTWLGSANTKIQIQIQLIHSLCSLHWVSRSLSKLLTTGQELPPMWVTSHISNSQVKSKDKD